MVFDRRLFGVMVVIGILVRFVRILSVGEFVCTGGGLCVLSIR